MSVRELPVGEAVTIVIKRLFSSLEVGGKTCAEARFKSGLAAKALRNKVK
jgi:hypothetical protein